MLQPIVPLGITALSIVLAGSMARAAGDPPALAPLMRSFEAYARDLERLDQVWEQGDDQVQSVLPALPAPAAAVLPILPDDVQIDQRVRVDLPQAIDLAVSNDPLLQKSIGGVREQQCLLRSIQGRLYPTVSFNLGAGYNQDFQKNFSLVGNSSLIDVGSDSPLLVASGGQNRVQTNIATGFAGLRVDYELLSFERNAALAELGADLENARELYGNRLRELQLNVSEAYYQLQLASQLRLIRQVVVSNDEVILDQILSMNTAGLVPRVDVLRAEASLQQQRFLLTQSEAQLLSRQRRLSLSLIHI